jgi:superfamily II DNA or RNA helicase
MKRNLFLFSKNKGGKKEKDIPFSPDESYKNNVCNNSYIGKKGYTIPKSVLCKEDEEFLKKDLFVKPELFGVVFGGTQFTEEIAFPVYRENDKKIYIPRFYGISRYGKPKKSEIDEGENIDVPFSKELRDYQENIIGIYINHVKNVNLDSKHVSAGCGGILEVKTGSGKTVMALKILSLLKKKTIILVHKEFLMNQWIERIEEFLPTARIGKIQGKINDTKDKDIVIGMIQSIYDKEYPPEIFSQFGLTIIDEVHRIASEQFSKTLLKIVTPYMLGISATVDRKDKLTKVLYMFIGDKIYCDDRKDYDPVCVRAIEYKTNNTEFNETMYDFRGMPQYSKMIVKLCEYGPRSDFIIKVIGDLLQEHPDKQIMILGHNRSLLTYLHDAIHHKQIATAGYYLGGMKESALKETETKQIVIATYSMAAEALDIKTLSTLVMVTPKTDIVQSVGRILRVKHEHPIIVDIVDGHDLFQNQWKQRLRFYRKCNYRVRKIDSDKYKGMTINWKEEQTWKRIFEPKIEVNKELEDDEEDGNKKNNGVGIGKCLINLDGSLS